MSSVQPVLTINLQAIAANWLRMKSLLNERVECSAVVKADAYGLGMLPAVGALVAAGCRTFYVAYLHEAMELEPELRRLEMEAMLSPGCCKIWVLTGCAPGEEMTFIQKHLRPVLISEEMVLRWSRALQRAGIRPGSMQAALKIDTGMARLGLEPAALDRLVAEPSRLEAAGIAWVMSHLACADEPEHAQNTQQLARFHRAVMAVKSVLPGTKASLASSAGILLGGAFHFDNVRPGIALYGGQPAKGSELDLSPVVNLRLPVLQVRELPVGGPVGYGASFYFFTAARTAVIGAGYADGLLRSLSNSGYVWISDEFGGPGWKAPIVGRVSMDSVIVDISHLPEHAVSVGQQVECLGERVSLDAQAEAADTISYELLTALGSRYRCAYLNNAP